MNLKNISISFFLISILSGCAQNAALLGPVLTIGTTGNVMQAGFSYGGNVVLKETTGKSSTEFVSSYVSEKNEEKKKQKIEIELKKYLANHIKEVRQRLYTNN